MNENGNIAPEQQLPIVLVVDDEPANIQVIAKALQPEYQVRFTTKGNKAVEMALSQKPDIILLDVVMPDLDGYTICKDLKSNEATADIPVMFVTAKSEEQFEAVGFEVGGVDYIAKPVKPFLLKARIRTHIELKRKNDFLRTLTTMDGLTGISNRRGMDDFVHQEWNRAIRRGNSWLSFILLDVDYFKLFNDHYGHQPGDDCLRQIANAIKSSLERSTDLAARYGGEEFACVLPETALWGTIKLAEKIQTSINHLALPHDYSKISRHVTVSIGVASVIPLQKMSSANLIAAADKQLYQAKNEGRNRICYIDLTSDNPFTD